MLYNNNTPNKNPTRDLNDNYYLSLKATFNRRVFRTDLKLSRDGAFLKSA